MDIAEKVKSALAGHPAISDVRLVGSRQRGEAGALSDWDLVVEATVFAAVARDLPAIAALLSPISQMWDPLSTHPTYMLILAGPQKVDLIFSQEHHENAPPWVVRRETLPAINAHFWDWILWLAGKHSQRKFKMVDEEFHKLSGHMLRPMGIEEIPQSIERAIALYRESLYRLIG